MENWIDIVEYAAKYNVSQSTLRRRIRAKLIPFKLVRGKYLLKDAPNTMEGAPLFARIKSVQFANSSEPKRTFNDTSSLKIQQSARSSALLDIERLEAENRHLRAQIGELQTLIKALESELSNGT